MGTCLRRLSLSHAYNVRDLGGYGTKDGKITKYHVFYRADQLSNLSEDEWCVLRDIGIRSVFDLRSFSETRLMGYNPEKFGICRYYTPFQKQEVDMRNIQKVLSDPGFRKSMEDGYVRSMEENMSGVAELLNAVCEKTAEGGVLFHCTAGKDRTGMLAASLLWLCQADEADIVADYQVSETYNMRNPMFQQMKEKINSTLLASPASRMWMLLNYFEQNNWKERLKQAGFRQESLELLEQNFLEDIG